MDLVINIFKIRIIFKGHQFSLC